MAETSAEPFPRLSAAALLDDYAAGARTPTQVVRDARERMAATEPTIHALVEQLDEATDAAEEATRIWREDPDRARALPLLGVPVVVKEKHQIAGHTVSQGVPALAENATTDHPIVARLRAAGAIPIARSATPEFCAATFTESLAWGTTRNPWRTDCTPGGSSGGSGAALAAGYAPLATGSDIGGSTRIPSTFCGVVGYKAPYGVVPGLHPSTMDWYRSDSAMARTVGDVLRMHRVIAGQHPADPFSVPVPEVREPEGGWNVHGRRVIVSHHLGDYPVDDDVLAGVDAAAAALERAGAVIEEREPDWRADELMDVALAHYGHTLGWGMAAAIARPEVEVSSYIVEFTEHVMTAAARMPIAETFQRETEIRRRLAATMDGALALISPVTTHSALSASAPAHSVDEHGRHYWQQLMAVPFNICNHRPVLAVPTGIGAQGVPIGVQIVGAPYDQQAVFRVGFALERMLPWADRHPRLDV